MHHVDEIFPPAFYHRADESDDRHFYSCPGWSRILMNAIAAKVELYHDILPPDSDVLDLMSSRYSHCRSPEHFVRRVVGSGMSTDELTATRNWTRPSSMIEP